MRTGGGDGQQEVAELVGVEHVAHLSEARAETRVSGRSRVSGRVQGSQGLSRICFSLGFEPSVAYRVTLSWGLPV